MTSDSPNSSLAVGALENPIGQLRLMVVEHHDVLRQVLVDALVQEGVDSVVAASSWAEFVQGARPSEVDLIVMDLDMPGQGGLQACRAVRERHPSALLIAVSAQSGSAHRIAALNEGADQLLNKPVSVDELVADVRRMVSRRLAGWAATSLHQTF